MTLNVRQCETLFCGNLMGLPKIQDFTPEFLWRFHDGNMIPIRKTPKSFWADVAVIKTKSKFFRYNFIASVHHDPDWPVIAAQIILRWKPVNEHEPHRQKRHVILCNARQPVEGRKQDDTRNLVGMCSRQIRGDAAAE